MILQIHKQTIWTNEILKNLFMKMLHSKSLTQFLNSQWWFTRMLSLWFSQQQNSELIRENTLSHSSDEYIRFFLNSGCFFYSLYERHAFFLLTLLNHIIAMVSTTIGGRQADTRTCETTKEKRQKKNMEKTKMNEIKKKNSCAYNKNLLHSHT